MSEIVVHRCELRIRRTAGWAWGASPDALINAATRAIPQLLAARLPAIASAHEGAEPIHITQPITVKIAATARDLAALAEATTASPEVVQLRARIGAALEAAVVHAVKHADRAPATTSANPTEPEQATPARELFTADATRRAVRHWWHIGTIEVVLARLEDAAVATLHDLLLGEGPSHEPPPEVLAAAEQALSRLSRARVSTLGRMRARIAIAAAVIDAVPDIDVKALRAAAELVPCEPVAAALDPPINVARDVFCGELEVRSALPFLLISTLHHSGWLDTAATLLALHRREGDAFALAAGLAAKVLDPLERGWKRTRADQIAMAAFVGRGEPIPDDEISAAATRLGPLLGALDEGLRGVIARARQSSRPVVLWRDAQRWLLIDCDGMVALAAETELPTLFTAAAGKLVLVPARHADRAALEALDYANLRFVTDAAPTRGESWRTFVGTARSLWTNDWATPAGKLVADTAHHDHWLALAEELAGVIAERPAIPRQITTSFEATCTLTATVALADIGARLFPAEASTPVLALTRFRDLDARVRFEPERVVVRVPLGSRHADLLRHGVLGTFASIPWLDGRTLDLGGG